MNHCWPLRVVPAGCGPQSPRPSGALGLPDGAGWHARPRTSAYARPSRADVSRTGLDSPALAPQFAPPLASQFEPPHSSICIASCSLARPRPVFGTRLLGLSWGSCLTLGGGNHHARVGACRDGSPPPPSSGGHPCKSWARGLHEHGWHPRGGGCISAYARPVPAGER